MLKQLNHKQVKKITYENNNPILKLSSHEIEISNIFIHLNIYVPSKSPNTVEMIDTIEKLNVTHYFQWRILLQMRHTIRDPKKECNEKNVLKN